jgi:hypothetical protein
MTTKTSVASLRLTGLLSTGIDGRFHRNKKFDNHHHLLMYIDWGFIRKQTAVRFCKSQDWCLDLVNRYLDNMK